MHGIVIHTAHGFPLVVYVFPASLDLAPSSECEVSYISEGPEDEKPDGSSDLSNGIHDALVGYTRSIAELHYRSW